MKEKQGTLISWGGPGQKKFPHLENEESLVGATGGGLVLVFVKSRAGCFKGSQHSKSWGRREAQTRPRVGVRLEGRMSSNEESEGCPEYHGMDALVAFKQGMLSLLCKSF